MGSNSQVTVPLVRGWDVKQLQVPGSICTVCTPCAHRVRNNFSRKWSTGGGVLDGTCWALKRYHFPLVGSGWLLTRNNRSTRTTRAPRLILPFDSFGHELRLSLGCSLRPCTTARYADTALQLCHKGSVVRSQLSWMQSRWVTRKGMALGYCLCCPAVEVDPTHTPSGNNSPTNNVCVPSNRSCYGHSVTKL